MWKQSFTKPVLCYALFFNHNDLNPLFVGGNILESLAKFYFIILQHKLIGSLNYNFISVPIAIVVWRSQSSIPFQQEILWPPEPSGGKKNEQKNLQKLTYVISTIQHLSSSSLLGFLEGTFIPVVVVAANVTSCRDIFSWQFFKFSRHSFLSHRLQLILFS